MSVPVLSKTTRVTAWALSRAAASRIRMPRRAAAPVPAMMAAGVAKPSAQGQAMTSTETAFSSAAEPVAPAIDHASRVARASASTTGTKTALTRSTWRWIGGLEAWAPSTRRTMRASTVSAPTEVVRIDSTPSRRMEPPATEAPGGFSTGRLSPVSMDSSTAPPPSSTAPSMGMRSPGRTTTMSPTAIWAIGTVSSVAPRRRRAVSGRRPASARRAAAVWPRARVSSHLPSRMKAISTAEDS